MHACSGVWVTPRSLALRTPGGVSERARDVPLRRAWFEGEELSREKLDITSQLKVRASDLTVMPSPVYLADCKKSVHSYEDYRKCVLENMAGSLHNKLQGCVVDAKRPSDKAMCIVREVKSQPELITMVSCTREAPTPGQVVSCLDRSLAPQAEKAMACVTGGGSNVNSDCFFKSSNQDEKDLAHCLVRRVGVPIKFLL